ncbi:MAG: non-heme iron oxygenase ferredoxin subunit [Ilumatobacteraceae bacterium]
MTKCRLSSLEELEAGAITRIEVDGVPLCVARLGTGEVYAISDVCSHEDIDLSDGDLQGFDVECPAHGSRFDVRTGAVSGLPAEEPVPAYQVTVEGDDVYVEI